MPAIAPRIEPLDAPYDSEVNKDFTALMPPGFPPLALFRTLAHNPRVLRRVRRGGLLDPGSITLRERELIILRTTALCRAEYEWGVHAAFFGGTAGFTEEQLHATVHGSSNDALWTASELLLLRLCDELHADAMPSDPLWTELSATYSPEQLVEILVLPGLYHAISYVINGARVPLEDAARTFPEA